MYNKKNPNYKLYLAGIITENQYYEILEGKFNEDVYLKKAIGYMKEMFKIKDEIDANFDDEKLKLYDKAQVNLQNNLYRYITTREDYDNSKVNDENKFNDMDYFKIRKDTINYIKLNNNSWTIHDHPLHGWTQFGKEEPIGTPPNNTQQKNYKWFWTIEPNSHKSFMENIKFLPSEFDKIPKLKDAYFSFKFATSKMDAETHRDTLVLHYKDPFLGSDLKKVVDNFIAKLKIVPVDRRKAFPGMASDAGVDVQGSSETELICRQVIKQIEFNQEVMKSLSDDQIINTIKHFIINAYDKSSHRMPPPLGISITDLAQNIKDPRWNAMYKQWIKDNKKDLQLAKKLYYSGIHHDMKYLSYN